MQSLLENDIVLYMRETLGPHLALKELEEISQVYRITRGIDGWLTELEGAALYTAAKYGPSKGAIVEIGSFQGRSTVWLAKGSKQVGRERVNAVDTHLGSPEHQPGGEYASHMPPEGTTESVFRHNIREAGLEDWIVPLVMSSADALSLWQDPIRLLFIDAEHAYEAVRSDFLSWQEYVVVGGLVVFHDVDRWDGSTVLDGPTRVVYEDVTQTGLYSDPIIVNHLAFVSKLRASFSPIA